MHQILLRINKILTFKNESYFMNLSAKETVIRTNRRDLLTQAITQCFIDKKPKYGLVEQIVDYVIGFFYDPDTCIADVWHYTSVQDIREDLTDEQAIQVLWAAYKDSDPDRGITISFIESWADRLFPL